MEASHDLHVGDRVEWDSYTVPPNGVVAADRCRYVGTITALNSHRTSALTYYYHRVIPDAAYWRNHPRSDGTVEVLASILRPANILDELARVPNG